MKLIIAGGRDIKVGSEFISDVLKRNGVMPWDVDLVICGGARGIDDCGKQWAYVFDVPVKHFPADWDKHGKSAGPIRNAEMAKEADALLLIWDGKSKGSSNMKGHMKYKTIYEVKL